jgi:hypothetical protein
MPSKTQKQYDFFKLVNAYKKGGLTASEVTDKVVKAADSMTQKQIDDFLKLKKEEFMQEQKKIFTDYLNVMIQQNVEEKRKKSGINWGVLQQQMILEHKQNKIKTLNEYVSKLILEANFKYSGHFKLKDRDVEYDFSFVSPNVIYDVDALKREALSNVVDRDEKLERATPAMIVDIDYDYEMASKKTGEYIEGGGFEEKKQNTDKEPDHEEEEAEEKEKKIPAEGDTDITDTKETKTSMSTGKITEKKSIQKEQTEIEPVMSTGYTTTGTTPYSLTMTDRNNKTAMLPYTDEKSATDAGKKFKTQGFKNLKLIGKGIIKNI